MLTFVSPSYAQTEPHGPAAGESVEAVEAHADGEHGAFPPFDPATFGSQLLWLAISFGLLYLLMSRVALPRIGSILANRNNRIAADLAEAARLKEESEAAIAAYEQALAEARQNAHAIALKARDAAKAEIEADRSRIEAELAAKLEAAETRIAEVKARALAEVDAIANEAAETLIEVLLGPRATRTEIAAAVQAAQAERT
ncbi:MAG TPA: F0F1 ATP synthase subunit B [Propylenella sp.]